MHEYDAIVKMRPDSKFWSENERRALLHAIDYFLDEHSAVGMDLYFSQTAINPTFQVSDKYAVGTSSAMHYYLETWDALASIWNAWLLDRNGTLPVGERLQYMRMRQGPYKSAPYPQIWWNS